MMMKRFLPALLASAALTLTLAACNDESPEGGFSTGSTPDNVAVNPLPPLPAVVDTSGGKKAPPPAANSVNRELSAQNAVEDIKKMQPQM